MGNKIKDIAKDAKSSLIKLKGQWKWKESRDIVADL